ncbi:nuclear transport factor 2 family protein [Sphingobium tyrosinilyticum]|uniref:Nuclear transport factor 2 family protein n=1 Tax=Sphingobium tyrosinilyticum TaxID=2715436 RepID=A0ABV9EY80_9SPHN
MDSQSAAIELLLDHQQITNVIHRYCRAADRLDVELFRTTFWGDGGFDGGPAEGPAVKIIPHLFENLMPDMWEASQHSISNILIELEGDRALVESYLTAFHLSHPTHASRAALLGEKNALAAGFKDDDVIEFIFGGRYIDVFEKRSGEWRILNRKIVPGFNRVERYTGIRDGGQYDLLKHRSSRDRDDPVYAR